ncbi:MAG: hypothetical protein ACD_44C00218G0004 [uncultured bacterium]|nr:MAG: hypothetical protein ACD_44C00218G0004 [uncultured bacterium]OGT15884.1 MAG: hypothetical protein A3B69_04865 [Gammaproteobacteria bacterium RIFCSPHIGHO2_02_FULL_38_33]OGT23329.1 MAG: hypothetical protein A2W47_03830 [Gammaproteobacteria bacterium RIFCSPHIGHO2_12_38_15]OGT75898.1 MAG: hypothetical protein A3G71_04200 [Gammaproteobacteria bacterium RIFCSPLOWO2_12_FULL_38_14]
MKEISLFEAKTHFSGLMDQVYKNHQEFFITRRGQKIAKIIPFKMQEKQDFQCILEEMKKLREEIGYTGITLNHIKKMKEEGRK